jgi:predicted ribosomally synthesized peptide with nif11-like leader
MSIESAKASYSRLTVDETFRTQLEQTVSDEERRRILQAAGYEFTREEWETTTAQLQASNSADGVSNAELQAVSGGIGIGGSYPPIPFPLDPVKPLSIAPPRPFPLY